MVTRIFSEGLICLSYGLFPHMCAAELTNQVMFRLTQYRNRAQIMKELTNPSPQKYIGIVVGMTKAMRATSLR